MPIHIKADPSELANTVLTPGNPQRAQYIADEYLEDVELYNDYRNLLGFTGYFDDKRVSVQTTGMGIPSANIVLEELNMLEVSRLIRIGTCGALSEELELSDLVLAQSAATIGTSINKMEENTILSPCSDFELTKKIQEAAKSHTTDVMIGQVATSDYFYEVDKKNMAELRDYGILAAEMETAGLFNKGAKYDLEVASVLTVSDLFFEEKRASQKVIQNGVDSMTKIVLETVSNL